MTSNNQLISNLYSFLPLTVFVFYINGTECTVLTSSYRGTWYLRVKSNDVGHHCCGNRF